MPRSSSLDPLLKFNFRVYVLSPTGANWIRGGFTSCSAPGITINYTGYPEGGRHLNPIKIHESATFKPITLSRGVIDKNGVDDFAKWVQDFYKVVAPQDSSISVQYRNDIVIEHLNRQGDPVKRFYLRNCAPSGYTPSDDFSSTDESVSVESLTFEYEGFEEERVDDTFGSTLSRLFS